MKTFITEKNGFEGPEIEALDFGHAEQLAKDIDDNLVVSGKHILTIQRDGFTAEDADRMCKALSEEV